MTAGGRGAHAADVARYYDRNTRPFLLVGNGRRVHAMHRELWGPGVDSSEKAADYVNTLVADELADLASRPESFVLDFGCGVGGTLFRLARHLPHARLKGVTVSGRQVAVAERLAAELGHDGRCSFVLADFETADLGPAADAIVAVESFTHSTTVDAFLESAARHLTLRGLLVVTDDFLAAEESTLDTRQRRLVGQFRAGWRLPTVCTSERLVEAAAGHGLEAVKVVDLTQLTRPGSRVRDRLVAATAPVLWGLRLGFAPFCGNIIGGDALQRGLREGFLRYRLVVLRRMRG